MYPKRFAPSVFLLKNDQLRPLSYHVYDGEVVHMGIRSYVPQRGVDTMSASILIRNKEIATKFRDEFLSNWKSTGLLDDKSYARILGQLNVIGDADRRDANQAVEECLRG